MALGLTPKAGVCDAVAVKGGGAGDPKAVPKEGVWLFPNPPEGAELKTNGEGPADGAEDEAAEGAVAAPKEKEGAAAGAALAAAPKRKG